MCLFLFVDGGSNGIGELEVPLFLYLSSCVALCAEASLELTCVRFECKLAWLKGGCCVFARFAVWPCSRFLLQTHLRFALAISCPLACLGMADHTEFVL